MAIKSPRSEDVEGYFECYVTIFAVKIIDHIGFTYLIRSLFLVGKIFSNFTFDLAGINFSRFCTQVLFGLPVVSSDDELPQKTDL